MAVRTPSWLTMVFRPGVSGSSVICASWPQLPWKWVSQAPSWRRVTTPLAYCSRRTGFFSPLRSTVHVSMTSLARPAL